MLVASDINLEKHDSLFRVIIIRELQPQTTIIITTGGIERNEQSKMGMRWLISVDDLMTMVRLYR